MSGYISGLVFGLVFIAASMWLVLEPATYTLLDELALVVERILT